MAKKRPSPGKYQKSVSKKTAPTKDGIRLNKFISASGICSRRDADKLIEAGEIKINDKIIKEFGYKVKKGDKVQYKGKEIQPEKNVYVLLNKPKGFITTTNDPRDRKTVMELVKKACDERIYPVGRLDRQTTGLLLFTNDGDFAQQLAHPSKAVPKLYEIVLDKGLSKNDFESILLGTELEDGILKVDELAIVSEDNTHVGVKIHSGKNRVIRRLFESYGYLVQKLDRVMYAGLDKKNLPRGKWRFLSDKEVIRLKYFQ